MTRKCPSAARRSRLEKKFDAIKWQSNKKTTTVTAARVYPTFLERLIQRPLLSAKATLWTSPTAASAAIGSAVLGTLRVSRLSTITLNDQSNNKTMTKPSRTNTDQGSTAPCASAANTTAIRNPTAITLLS